jgi:hypothetical protein
MVSAEGLAGLILIERRSHTVRQDHYKETIAVGLDRSPAKHRLHSIPGVGIAES